MAQQARLCPESYSLDGFEPRECTAGCTCRSEQPDLDAPIRIFVLYLAVQQQSCQARTLLLKGVLELLARRWPRHLRLPSALLAPPLLPQGRWVVSFPALPRPGPARFPVKIAGP